ncbi:GTP-binding protein [Thalassotalea sp. M1531]|uniref:GTP-binding protein n=1 Tax=Thalassotalea algicola TaxID=2716224 RepID=A0A7Y0LDE3_9GAMM|nr:GTP-binding protein [Thalassotalea algicola]
MNNEKITSVPTNIITGFLGVGKTSAILHLLKQKPSNERWAVLVNEFGEIGVDGSLIKGQLNKEQSVFIREVTGGCMCCASGLPMQIALNQLLNEAKPDRLLIEPTGLGHPVEVLQVLSNQYYKDILNLQKTITLVDARNLSDSRYTDHEAFNQQLGIADIIVGSKKDLYRESDEQALVDYMSSNTDKPKDIVFIEHGKLPFELLAGKSQFQVTTKQHHHKHRTSANELQPIPESGFIKAINKGEGFESIGWRFAPYKIFDRVQLHAFLTSLKVNRLKAVFITSDGIFGYNTVNDGIVEFEIDECVESRIEIICEHIDKLWEAKLISMLCN